MTFGQPKTIGSKLFERIEKLFEDTHPNNFSLIQIKKDTEKLAHANAYEASMVKSAIAAFEWDAPAADYWIRNACNLQKFNSITHLNAAVTFKLLNDLDKAIKHSEIAINLAPQDPYVVQPAVENFIMGGVISKAENAVKSVHTDKTELIMLNSEIQELQKVLAKLNISESQLQNEIRQATQVAAARRIRISSIAHAVYSDPEDDVNYCVSIAFRGNLDDEISLEGELAEILSADENWNPLKLTVEFTHCEIEDELYAD